MGERLNVFTIPAGTPFLPTLADALVDRTLFRHWPDGAELADATVYLPTRRAGRALATLLAERAHGRAALLPRIVPLGETPGDPLADAVQAGADPPLSALERRLILARLVQGWSARVGDAGLPGSPADAVALAADLEGLMDSLATEGVPWEALAGAVETDFSRHFALTLRFLRIAHEEWPGILRARRASDPARHQHDAIRAEADRLARRPADGPVVAAGSTGSIPATARLLAAIARLPSGAVVLPGLDAHLDPASWDLIGGGAGGSGASREPIWGHPQFMMHRLLGGFGIDRDAVRTLGAPQSAPAEARRRLLSEVMRPAETTDRWAGSTPIEHQILVDAGTEGLGLLVAADEREEALAIAVAIREALVEPDRTVALVTPDRALARRVAAELGRWGIAASDSAGVPLSDSAAGRLARLAAAAAASEFRPIDVLALLAHPAVTVGLARADLDRAAAALEIGALRGPAPRPGLAGIEAALELRRREVGKRDPLPRQRLSGRDWDAARDLVRWLEGAFAAFGPAGDDPDDLDLAALAGAHAGTVRALVAPAEGAAETDLHGIDGLLDLFDDLALTADGSHAVRGRFADYPAFFRAVAAERSLPPEPRATHRRVRILGLLEARLLDIDRLVLGVLDEGIWPPTAETDSFLNRPMRLALGLSPPERRIGQTAHDFAQALGCAEVLMTRARKRDGKPTVPSRFLERLKAFAGETAWAAMAVRGGRYRDLAAALERTGPVPPLRRPAPCPGPDRFPRELSVSEVETLVRDPYAIYARHILKLTPLDPVGLRPSLAERGSILHDILARFAADHPDELPADAERELLRRGQDAFGPVRTAFPELAALWEPDFRRLVPFYLAWERERRAAAGFAALHLERYGRLDIPLAAGAPLRVRGIADRIEIGSGRAAIVDYKSGGVPTAKVVQAGFSPQLTLEAAMLRAGGFREVEAVPSTPELLYVKLGGRDRLKPTEVKPAAGQSLAALVDEHVRGLAGLARLYAEDGAGYLSRPYAQYAQRYSSYDHLARVGEWSVADDDEAGA